MNKSADYFIDAEFISEEEFISNENLHKLDFPVNNEKYRKPIKFQMELSKEPSAWVKLIKEKMQNGECYFLAIDKDGKEYKIKQ